MNIKKLAKVRDEVFYTGTIEWGNQNDFVNMINRVSPDMSEEQVEKLQNEIEEIGTELGDKLVYRLETSQNEDADLNFNLKGNLILTIFKV